MSRKRTFFLLCLLIFLMGAGAASYMHWPALTHYGAYKADILQSPHWAAYHTDSFREDDLILEYARFNESPVQNSIYYIGTFFIDFITLTKLLAIVSYGAAALLFFVVGRALYGLRAGLLMAAFFTFFPHQFDFSAGFFSKYWVIPSLLVTMYVLQRERFRWLLWLLPFTALAYPVIPLIVGMTGGIRFLMLLFEDRTKAWTLFRNLALGSLPAVAILLYKYLSFPVFVGPMAARDELLSMPSMIATSYVPIPSLFEVLGEQLAHPFVGVTAVVYLLVLRKNVRWEKCWTALFAASCIGYVLADAFFMRIYIPNRYVRYSLAVLLILWHACNSDAVLSRIPRRIWRHGALAALLVGAAASYQEVFFLPGNNFVDRTRREGFCRFIRGLPDGVLIAGPPHYLDDVMAQSRRSVLSPHRLLHPWFPGHYDYLSERILDMFRAIYATEPEAVDFLHRKYGVTHLVTGSWTYGVRVRKRNFYHPRFFNDRIADEIVGANTSFLLEDPPAGSVVYRDNLYQVIRLPLTESALSGK